MSKWISETRFYMNVRYDRTGRYSGRDIVMKSAGTQTRSYVYVADCVSGISFNPDMSLKWRKREM